MLDTLVEELNQFSETDFINVTLKRIFFAPFYDKYDLRVPMDALDGEKYTMHFGEFYDWESQELHEKFEIEHEFIIFLKNQLLGAFKRFSEDLFNQCKFEPNEDKRNYFLRFIYLQLKKEVLPKIQANDYIKPLHKEVILTVYHEELNKVKSNFKIILNESIVSSKKVKSFKYNNRFFEHNLSQLLSSLKNGGLISGNTLKVDFFKLFMNVVVANKITWTGSKSEFYYFITQINSLDDFTDYKSKKWEIASSCFLLLDKKGKELDWRTFRSLKKPSEAAIKKIDNYLKL